MASMGSSFGGESSLLQTVSAKAGLTKAEFIHEIFLHINSGKIMDIISVPTQAELCDWIESQGLLFGGEFLIVLDICEETLYCRSEVSLNGTEPLILIQEVNKGSIPYHWDSSLPSWPIPFWAIKIGEDYVGH